MATASDRHITLSLPPGSRTIVDTRDDQGRYILELGLSEEMNQRLEELALRTRDASKAQIINQAIGLYKAVSDAIRDGKRVGIVDDPNVEFETEFVDF